MFSGGPKCLRLVSPWKIRSRERERRRQTLKGGKKKKKKVNRILQREREKENGQTGRGNKMEGSKRWIVVVPFLNRWKGRLAVYIGIKGGVCVGKKKRRFNQHGASQRVDNAQDVMGYIQERERERERGAARIDPGAPSKCVSLCYRTLCKNGYSMLDRAEEDESLFLTRARLFFFFFFRNTPRPDVISRPGKRK